MSRPTVWRNVLGLASGVRIVGYRSNLIIHNHTAFRRQFGITPVVQKKKASKSAKEQQQDKDNDIEVAVYDPQSFKSSCDKILADLKANIQEARMGKTDLKTLNGLKIQINSQKIVLESLGQVSLRGGRHIIVSVYDPQTVKAVSAGILAANLNMNPQVDPSNSQTLLIPIPPPTRESRQATAKFIKSLVESAKKSGPAGTTTANKKSIHHERAKAMAAVQLMKQASYSKDMTMKLESQIEKINKDYLAQLTKLQDDATQAVMRS
ncbi:ribosome recycling factor-domain-containing protein [Lipomyces kononenkoae]